MRSPSTIVAALVLAGCATTYEPMKGPRVHQVLEDGRVMLVRDGTKFPADASGLWQAVHGNHKAEEHAARYGMWTSFGFASALLGSGLVAGAAYAETQGEHRRAQQPGRRCMPHPAVQRAPRR
jgi:hypothetical protein